MAHFNFDQKVVWLTGASSGIGRALAEKMADRGARVALTARRRDLLEDLRDSLVSRSKRAAIFPGDVSDPAAMKAIEQQIRAELGPIEVAVFNAGVNLPHRATGLSAETLERIFKVNVGGAMAGIEAVLPGMLQRRSGYIVGVASLASYRPLPVAPAYGASKAALDHLLSSMRFSLEPMGIYVTVVNPGFVKTPMTDGMKQPMPFLMDADSAAQRVVEGMERLRREIHFPRRLSLFMKALRLLPYPLYHRLLSAAVKG